MFHLKSNLFPGVVCVVIAGLGLAGLNMGRVWTQGLWQSEDGFGEAMLRANAHQVEIAGDVGGTIHIEPNDTPKAGEAALAWFALTKRGGEAIPLADCDCHLDIYHAPYTPGDTPFSCPDFRTISAEGFEGIPGADVVFPDPGSYDLVVTGTPSATADFEPFELIFSVTVAR